jgi:hypothetical protein
LDTFIDQHVRETKAAKVRAVMARVPANVSEDTRRIFEQEVEDYLNGAQVKDRELVELYLKAISTNADK